MDIFIDKIENNIAELHFDNDEIIHINLKHLPKGIKEGDYLNIEFKVNKTKRKEVEKNVESLIEELSGGNYGGDFEL